MGPVSIGAVLVAYHIRAVTRVFKAGLALACIDWATVAEWKGVKGKDLKGVGKAQLWSHPFDVRSCYMVEGPKGRSQCYNKKYAAAEFFQLDPRVSINKVLDLAA